MEERCRAYDLSALVSEREEKIKPKDLGEDGNKGIRKQKNRIETKTPDIARCCQINHIQSITRFSRIVKRKAKKRDGEERKH